MQLRKTSIIAYQIMCLQNIRLNTITSLGDCKIGRVRVL